MKCTSVLRHIGQFTTQNRLTLTMAVLAAVWNALGEPAGPALDRDRDVDPPGVLLPGARLNPRFGKLADDPAYVMPVGSGDLSAMVRFDGAPQAAVAKAMDGLLARTDREIIWPMGPANHLDLARRSLDFLDGY